MKYFFPLSLFLTTFSFGQVQFSSNTKADIIEIIELFESNGKSVTGDMRSYYPINDINGTTYVSFIASVNDGFDEQEMNSRGINIGSRVADIVSVRYPILHLESILEESSFDYVKIAGKIKPHLDRVKIGTRVDSVWAGINLPQGYTGKDVIIGITDWGFDYTSPMFYDTLLQNSRVLGAWDQFKTSGPAPAPYGYGAAYNTFNDLQAAGSDTSNIYSYHTHGTHVAGIAGGSGAGLEYRGMAFESEFLFVTFRVDESFVLDAWQWMHDKAQAEGKNLVINMSWGLYHFGALDGTDLLEQAIDTYSSMGVLFVSSAGNNGDVTFHIQKDFVAADTISSQIAFYSNPAMPEHWGQSVHYWGEAGNEFTTQLVITDMSNNIVGSSPWYSTVTTANYIDSFVVIGTDSIFYNLSMDAAYPSNGRPQARLRVKYADLSYRIGVFVTAPTGVVHMWNVTELSNDVGNWGMPFYPFGTFSNSVAGDNLFGIGVPTCATSCVSVGAYVSEFKSPSGTLVGGQEIAFSSNGPLMDGTLKPDVSAPGVNVASSISSFTDASFGQIDFVEFNGRTYPFARFSGTSMSSPATAGVAAVIWESNPYLTPAQIKNVLIQTARIDTHTGTIPPHSAKWGWGKVNAYDAVQWAVNIVGVDYKEIETRWYVYPNPSSDQISVFDLEGDFDDISVIDLGGRKVIKSVSSLNIDISNLMAGTYFVRIINNGKVEQQKFIKR